MNDKKTIAFEMTADEAKKIRRVLKAIKQRKEPDDFEQNLANDVLNDLVTAFEAQKKDAPRNFFVTRDGLPSQPLLIDKDGVARFRANAIVRILLDNGKFDMNALALVSFTNEDREQFAQLIGYSISGFGELSYVSEDAAQKADALVCRLSTKRSKS